MILKEANGVKWLEFEHLNNKGLRHCFSTRIGGESTGCFESMNLGFSRGDDRETVLKNYERLCDAVGFKTDSLIFSNQVHGTDIYKVTAADQRGLAEINHVKEKDGLLTTEKGVTLVTFYADCVPLFFYDPMKQIIASSHSGWRGTVNQMAKSTIKEMQELGSNPSDILAGIGPSICGDCFEVDFAVADEFLQKLPFSSAYIKSTETKSYIDLKRINYQIMVECGVLESNIEISNYCTMCEPELFYSHRGMGNSRGSLAAFMELL